jgi:hypothetical protein
MELWALLGDDVLDLAAILGRKIHPRVTSVAYVGNGFKKLGFRERGREGEESEADRRGQIDLLRKTDSGVVLYNTQRFVHPSSRIKCLPVKQIRTHSIKRGDTVFDGLKAMMSAHQGRKQLDWQGLTTPFIGT